jgi:hypothetical protein
LVGSATETHNLSLTVNRASPPKPTQAQFSTSADRKGWYASCRAQKDVYLGARLSALRRLRWVMLIGQKRGRCGHGISVEADGAWRAERVGRIWRTMAGSRNRRSRRPAAWSSIGYQSACRRSDHGTRAVDRPGRLTGRAGRAFTSKSRRKPNAASRRRPASKRS